MMATTTQSIETKRPTISSGLILAVLLSLAGFAAWIYQLVVGLEVTGLGQQVVWGMYIAAFFTAVGAGASLLALAGISEYHPLLPADSRQPVLALALSAFVAGGILITMDVGNPLQLWRLITGFEFSSLMTWDFWLLVLSALVGLIYLLQARQGQPQKLLGGLGVMTAFGVVAVESWMLTTLTARLMWGSGLILITFLVGAAVAGVGVAMLVLPQTANRLRQVLFFGLGLSLLLVTAEVLTGLLSNNPRVLSETRLLLTGSAAPIFWLHLIAGLVLPLLLLRVGQLRLAGGLALIGVLAEKLWLLASGQAEPWVELPLGSYFILKTESTGIGK
jgi:dimethyl sulfoxide reductase membrane subunit